MRRDPASLRVHDATTRISDPASREHDAVAAFAAARAAGRLPHLYKAHVRHGAGAAPTIQEACRIFGALPVLTPETVSAEFLVKAGLWPASAALKKMGSLLRPRYFYGRHILLSDAHGTLVGWEDGNAIVNVVGGAVRRVPATEVAALNQPHILPRVGSELLLEDGVKLDYRKPLTRAKMCEIALALAPHAAALANALARDDFDSSEAVQLACVVAIRTALDITTFQRGGGGRARDRSRYCRDDAARFAIGGEGHCRTVSSVLAAFLLPWTQTLGFDLAYREDVRGRHQWLELTLRPRMRSFVCDPYRASPSRASGGGRLLALPVEEAYGFEWDFPCSTPTIGGRRIGVVELTPSDNLFT